MMDKKARLLSLWWALVLIVIVAGISIGVVLFYSAKTDVRMIEARIIAEKASDCLVELGYFNSDFLNSNFDVYNSCGFDEKTMNESGSYFLKITASNSSGVLKSASYGNNAFEKECEVQRAVSEAEKFPICIVKRISTIDSNGNDIKLEIKGGSNFEYRLGQ